MHIAASNDIGSFNCEGLKSSLRIFTVDLGLATKTSYTITYFLLFTFHSDVCTKFIACSYVSASEGACTYLFVSAVPDYAKLQGDITYAALPDPFTGLFNVTYTFNVTSHWSSLAVYKSVFGRIPNSMHAPYHTIVYNITVSLLCS